MNTGGRHKAPRKANCCLQKEVVFENIKDKKRDKRIRDEDPSWGGSAEGGVVSKHQGNPFTGGSVGSFGMRAT